MTTTTKPSPSDSTQDEWEYISNVAVDSGRLLLIDPMFATPTEAELDLALQAEEIPCAQVPISDVPDHNGFICQSGWGDGIYPVFVRTAPNPFGSGEIIAEMRVVFLQEAA
jgi:hypothetical protein